MADTPQQPLEAKRPDDEAGALPQGARRVLDSARLLGVAVVGAALVMLLVGSMLHVRAGWGIEDFLGWSDDGITGPVAAMSKLWDESQRMWLARSYLVLDSVAFVPIYVAFSLQTGWILVNAIRRDFGSPQTTTPRWFVFFWLPVLLLAAVDLTENLLGLMRTGGWGLGIGLAALTVGLLALWLACDFGVWRVGKHPMALAAGAVGVALLCAWKLKTSCVPVEGATWLGRALCTAHHSKTSLILLVAGVLAAAALCWLFGVVLSVRDGAAIDRARLARRAALRMAILDCLVRSRYVLAALAILGGLTLVMDQSRDVVGAMASFLPRFLETVLGASAGVSGWTDAALMLFGSLAVFALSVLALALLVFACWMWTRSACHLRAAGRPAVDASDPAPAGQRHEDFFARDWARVLALVPVLMVVLLCASVLQDIAKAQAGADAMTGQRIWALPLVQSLGVLAYAVLSVLLGGRFIWKRGEQAADQAKYYDCIEWAEWSERAGLTALRPKDKDQEPDTASKTDASKYNFLGKVTPYALPIAALVLVLACRAIDVLPGRSGEFFPSLAFPIILLSLTFWLCFFGWLSLLEIRAAVPWVLVLIIWAGVLGVAGCTDNHVVWSGDMRGEANTYGALLMLLCTAALGLVMVVAYQWAMQRVRQPNSAGALKVYGPLLLTIPALTAAIMAGNFLATARRPTVEPAVAAPKAETLDAAMARWLRLLCNAPDEASGCTPSVSRRGPTQEIDVYFVSSEGGGIRAAAWTALALNRFEQEDPGFAQRTFSISAVSGGAVGAAVYRACGGGADSADREKCILEFAKTDLLSPLVSSWMFEDLLGRLVPSGVCRTPGCGFMSRGAWFEQVMEVGAPRLRRGIRELRDVDSRGNTRHVPYLLLNATWVETGERAIATELIASTTDFPGSKDQLALVGTDMPLGAAAHNAARFPYVNAIGSLRTPAYRCAFRGAGVPEAPNRADPSVGVKVCGHLADGGYFDNGGAQSTSDIVRAFAACLTVVDGSELMPKCAALPKEQRLWLRENLVPRILMIRNETDPGAGGTQECRQEATQPTGVQVSAAADRSCTTAIGAGYTPGRSVCAGGKYPYLDAIGPLLTVINTSGIGANGRLAEAREGETVLQARRVMGAKAKASTAEAVTAIDLLPKGVHFPLGWHLSPPVVKDMKAQAKRCSAAPATIQP